MARGEAERAGRTAKAAPNMGGSGWTEKPWPLPLLLLLPPLLLLLLRASAAAAAGQVQGEIDAEVSWASAASCPAQWGAIGVRIASSPPPPRIWG